MTHKLTQVQRELKEQNDAEISVVGALLIEPERYYDAAEIITSEDFYYNFHRTIFELIGDIYKKTNECDLTILLERILVAEPERNRAEVKEYLMRMADNVVVIDNIKSYCHIVKQCSKARKALEIAQELSFTTLYQGEETYSAIQEVAEKFAELVRDKEQRKPRVLSEILHDVYMDIFGDLPDLSINTGIHALDKILDGIYPGDTVTIAAGTSVGKTAFALKIISYMAKCGKNILLYSQEMTDKQNAIRLIAKQSGIDMYKLKKSGRLTETEKNEVENAFEKLYKLPIEIKDSGGITVEDIRLDCVSNKGYDVIFIDHIGLMRGSKTARHNNRCDQITQIMIELRALALQIKKPIIILSQFNRAAMSKDEPDLTCFRDSGEIEQSSSAAILLWRLADYDTSGMIGIKVAKNRQGSNGKFYMKFDAAKMDFLEVSVDYKPPKGFKSPNTDMNELFG